MVQQVHGPAEPAALELTTQVYPAAVGRGSNNVHNTPTFIQPMALTAESTLRCVVKLSQFCHFHALCETHTFCCQKVPLHVALASMCPKRRQKGVLVRTFRMTVCLSMCKMVNVDACNSAL